MLNRRGFLDSILAAAAAPAIVRASSLMVVKAPPVWAGVDTGGASDQWGIGVIDHIVIVSEELNKLASVTIRGILLPDGRTEWRKSGQWKSVGDYGLLVREEAQC